MKKIGTYYCKAGTVREISALRSQALTQIDQLLTKASNEVNATFTDNTAKLPIFVIGISGAMKSIHLSQAMNNCVQL